MNIVRMAMISPHVVGDGRAVCRGTPSETRSARQAIRTIRSAPRLKQATWRRALIEAYPIVGLALFLAYFVWMVVSNMHFAR